MADTDQFSDLVILALTLIGEFESGGARGMSEVANTIVNRVKANKWWGHDIRTICLFPWQYDAWWPAQNNPDRERILHIATANPLYGPYTVAMGIAGEAIAGTLVDTTSGATHYYNPHNVGAPKWARALSPVFIDEPHWFYDLSKTG